ncbi:MAG TPA: universal stress protein [Clostridia bacterium]|nr:universal stress protein [Clostridia bacterium]
MNMPVVGVPLDGSEQSLSALPVANVLAELESAIVHLVHIAREVACPAEVLEPLGLNTEELRGSVLNTNTGEPAAGTIQAARESQYAFIVMCTHTALAVSGRILGGTALGILKATTCPVVLVNPERGAEPWSLRRILVPHDGTSRTSVAIRPAANLARYANAELNLLHIAAPAARPPDERGSLAFRYMDQPQYEWPAWAGEFVDRLHCVCPLESLNVHMAFARGSPDEEVLRFADENASDLIVLAWRGEWEREHATTLKAIIRRAPCPVMIVRAAE